MQRITTYDTRTFTDKFMPSEALAALLRGDVDRFYIMRLEDMYQHVHQAVPPSRSRSHSCLYLTMGSATMKIGSESYTIQKGELLFVPAGQVFSFGAHDVNAGYIFHFHDIMLGGQDFEFLRVWGNPVLKPDTAANRFVLHLLKRLVQEYSENGHTQVLQNYFLTLLYEIDRFYEQPTQYSGQPAAVQITRRFRELLFTYIRQHQRVTHYAALLNISPNHLNKSVRAVSGKSPTRWIDEAIVQEAKVLLSQSPASISETAMELGIDDASYFTRLFRKYEGITPTEYRKLIEKS
jgi:AraC family transcriptional regulator, transcriptional activator of pobA